MSIFNSNTDNGWVPIRRNLFDHYEDGRMTLCEYNVFLLLLLMAKHQDGTVSIGPTQIKQTFGRDFSEDQCKKVLSRLVSKGYIKCIKPSVKKGTSALYLVDKYEVWNGDGIVKRVEVKRLTLALESPNGTPSVPQVGTNVPSYIDLESIPYEESEEDSALEPPIVPPSRHSHRVTSQQEQEQEQEQEHTNGGVGGTASNEPTPVGFARPERRSAKLGAHTRPARQPEDDQRWSMGELHDLRLSDDDFDPLDYAFGMATDEDESFRDIQRAVWYHWKVIPPNKRYWADPKQGRITSRVRLEFNLERMLERVPDDFEIPLWLYEQIPIHDLNCKLCGGIGSFPGIVNDVDYPAWMKMTCYEPCSCQCPHPYPWRLDPERMNNSPLEVSHAS